MTYNHSSQVKSYLGYFTDQDPDIFLVSTEGVKVGTHRIVLRLFSVVLSDILTQSSDSVSHVSLPASGSVLKNLVNTLNTGLAITKDRDELNKVAEVAELLGLGYVDWQIGLERKKMKEKVEEIKIEDESLKGFVFDGQTEENQGQNSSQFVVKMEIIPDVVSKCLDIQKENCLDDVPNVTGGAMNDSFRCDYASCLKTFTVKKNLRKHERIVHGASRSKVSTGNLSDNVQLNCDKCEKSFKTKKYQRRHMKDIHEFVLKKESKKPCPECNKVHGYNPKNDEHYSCDLCSCKFYGMKIFKRHRNTTHGIRVKPEKVIEAYDAENPHHCHQCHEACKGKTDFIFHQDTKHVEGSPEFLNCRFCERKIKRKQKGYFMEHLRTHTGERPEICSYCGQTFKHKKALKNHERLHTGEKPYKCEFCYTAFTQQNGLTSHQKSKSGCRME